MGFSSLTNINSKKGKKVYFRRNERLLFMYILALKISPKNTKSMFFIDIFNLLKVRSFL